MKFDLRQARSYAGYSQEEVAQKIGVAKVTYQMYETGRRNMKVNTAKKFSKLVNIPIEQIIF
ncbi:helix-turn-helix transcriptional regulator [Limosilactobacillus vaginalis]|uniref:helix-turn-helix transcriptional regulator n=1 Tax=Limosilactobacillus vaginalis TaxID=1633 RepID=UPI000BEF030D|nr:helix-turn-helix transcriptional regulator [Limosilactobacillus vaginalis]PEH04760.1 transcriptional regulator [Lactobacillus sp. UMNPBX5]